MSRNGPAHPVRNGGNRDGRMVLNSDRVVQQGLRLAKPEIDMAVILKVRKRDWMNKIIGEAVADVFARGWEPWLAERPDVKRYAATRIQRPLQHNTKLAKVEVDCLHALRAQSKLSKSAVVA